MPAQTTLDPGRTFQERLEKLKTGPRGTTPWGVPALVRAGSSLGDAIAGHRTLGTEDRTVLGTTAFLVLLLAVFSDRHFFTLADAGRITVCIGVGIPLAIILIICLGDEDFSWLADFPDWFEWLRRMNRAMAEGESFELAEAFHRVEIRY